MKSIKQWISPSSTSGHWTNVTSGVSVTSGDSKAVERPNFHFDTAEKELKCQCCKNPIYKGEPLIKHGYKFLIEDCLCISCVLNFVVKSVPNAKTYAKLVKEARARKVMGEL